MKAISFKKKLRYIIEAFFAYLFYFFFKSLGIESSSKIGAIIVGFFSKFIKENNIAAQNIKMCLPHLTKEHRKKILINTWKHFGSVIGEIPHWYKMPKKEFLERVTIKGEKNMPLSRAIIVSGHIGNWELISRIAKEYNIKLNLVYRPSNNPYTNNLINKIREVYKINLIPKGNIGVKPSPGNPLWNGSKLQRAIFWCHLISIGLLLVVVSSDQTLTLILKISVECKDEEAAMHNLIFLIQLGLKRRESKSR